MEIEVIKKMVEKRILDFNAKIKEMDIGEDYYKNKSDITKGDNKSNSFEDNDIKPKRKNPMRNADNRVSFPFHKILVDQKASYMMTNPPTFSVDEREGLDKKIKDILGNKFSKVAKDLVINAANFKVAWLHVWRGEKDNKFKYSVVDSRQIIPIFSPKLDTELLGCLRVYPSYNEQGESIDVVEYWTEEQCETYFKKKDNQWKDIQTYNNFDIIDNATRDKTGRKTNTFKNEWGRVPFIPFFNNSSDTSDLDLIKKIIDVYEKIFSGFVNDLDDLQEVIFILTNYGGTDKEEFLQGMKKYKAIKFDVDEGEQAGIDTLQIEIPIEARKELLNRAEDAIFKQGMGVNPTKEDFSNTSGAALNFIYSLLELKAGITETEFRLGFDTLIWFILSYLGQDTELSVEQTWERSKIRNDSEEADVVAKLANISSNETIAYANPLVTDPERELKLLKEKKQDNYGTEADLLAEKISTNETDSVGEDGEVHEKVQPTAKTNKE